MRGTTCTALMGSSFFRGGGERKDRVSMINHAKDWEVLATVRVYAK